MNKLLVAFFVVASLASAKIYFKESFDKSWESRWVISSKWKAAAELGKLELSEGKIYGDSSDKGLKTTEDARFYGLSAKMDEVFNNEGKDLVVQYSVKYDETPDCGGAYIKLLPKDTDQESFGGDSPYAIMFGPDVCGSSTRRTHVIFTYNGKNLLMKSQPRIETDQLTHLYTLIVKSTNTYEFRIDNQIVSHGSLYDDWEFLLPKKIDDPEAHKPEDWVDEEEIDDPTATKPEGWDDIQPTIADPDAKQPEDWDAEEDGEWEPPTKPNPEYKGEWKAPKIKNPDYKGPWVHPQIDNPDFVNDEKVYNVCKDCGAVGFELWQVKSGSIFDDIIVTDSIEEAEEFAKETYFKKIEGEKKMKEKMDEEKKRQEEEAKAKEEEEKKEKEEAEKDDKEEEL